MNYYCADVRCPFYKDGECIHIDCDCEYRSLSVHMNSAILTHVAKILTNQEQIMQQ